MTKPNHSVEADDSSIIEFAACDLKPGMLVDLEKDPFADPKGESSFYHFEYATVESVELETATCVAVSFEGIDVVGFPVGHRIKVKADSIPAPDAGGPELG